MQIARCVWRPERGSCWRCTRRLPPYHCSVCCLLQVQVARCVWRPERGSCWSCDMPYATYYCSVCCLPQVQVARCVWRPQRGSCCSCTHHLPPYLCSAFSIPQVQVARCVSRPERRSCWSCDMPYATLSLQCVLYTSGANRQVCVTKEDHVGSCTRHLPVYHRRVLSATGASRQVCVATRKRIMPELRHVICRLIIAVCVVCRRCKSPGVCDERGSCWSCTRHLPLCQCRVLSATGASRQVCVTKEDHVGVAHFICRSISAECCLPQVQVARCVATR